MIITIDPPPSSFCRSPVPRRRGGRGRAAIFFRLPRLIDLKSIEVGTVLTRRLIATFEAINGWIIFGWTTALILAFIEPLYFRNGS